MPGPHVLAIAGGVGGAKLTLGLARALPPEQLTVVVNTGDDETFHGLHVSPDVDSVTYALAGLTNMETGWGVADDSFRVPRGARAAGGRDLVRPRRHRPRDPYPAHRPPQSRLDAVGGHERARGATGRRARRRADERRARADRRRDRRRRDGLPGLLRAEGVRTADQRSAVRRRRDSATVARLQGVTSVRRRHRLLSLEPHRERRPGAVAAGSCGGHPQLPRPARRGEPARRRPGAQRPGREDDGGAGRTRELGWHRRALRRPLRCVGHRHCRRRRGRRGSKSMECARS